MPNDDNRVDFLSQLKDFITQQTSPIALDSLEQAFSDSTQPLQPHLDTLIRQGQIMLTRSGEYTLPERLGLVVGQVIGHRDGYGFLRTADKGNDLFIPSRKFGGSMHGDTVLAAPGPVDKKGRQEARILKVLEVGQHEIVGRFFRERSGTFVAPDDSRLNCDIWIDDKHTLGARQGQVVVVELLVQDDDPVVRGQVIEVLGETMAPGMEVEMALRSHDIPHEWPVSINKALAKIPESLQAQDYENREDLRQLPLMTIDGEDARDFDDAVYCETKKSGGWRLWVAIADVSYYVRSGSALDTQAYERGTSVYFPDQVVPMLPEKLSNGLCSLNPQVDRACLVCEMTISSAGRLSSYRFYPAVMHSHARLTYNKVAAMLEGDELLRERYAEQLPHVQELHRLFLALKEARAQRGGIELETQETRFIFNAQRKIEQIVPLLRNDAHKMIEECMIQANVAAARFVEKHKAAILFRVHDKPSTERLNNFRSFLNELGLTLEGGEQAQPKDYFELVASIQERDDRDLIQTMLLRSMMQAVYQPDNIGHFGLALKSYAHFTSPIRRYPDLLLHRVIKYLLAKEQGASANRWTSNGGYYYSFEEMDAFGEHCSMTERRADDATREVCDKLKCEFMLDHVGEVLSGTIAAVTNFGLFVRLNTLQIDGLVHISNLGHDYFEYDAARQILIGRGGGMRYRIGDAIEVKVASVNMDDRKIDLFLANSDGEKKPRSRQKSKVADKKSPNNTTKKTVLSSSAKPAADKPSRNKKKAGVKKTDVVKSKKKRKRRPGKQERATMKKALKS
ncbi:ribonuclease R [Celerinatantimonas yamalensis]|uniref:Ribonuclease R n=1 Tax=Celerinatantimonas yamalensis TaxID=559956 RepID=A0ABW9G5C6_9GAMM